MQGLVLRAIPYKDKDLILQVLSNEIGKISIYAPRQRSGNKHGQSRLEIFDVGKFELGNKHSDLHTLKFFKPSASFPHLRDSLNKLSIASFVCEGSSLVLADENDTDSSLFDQLKNTLSAISTAEDLKAQLKSAFNYFVELLSHSGLIEPEKFSYPSKNSLQQLIQIAEQHCEHRFQSRAGLDQVFNRLA